MFDMYVLLQLPIKIDVIKHAREIDGKSTAIHAAILAPEDVTVYIYPDFPKFSSNDKVSEKKVFTNQDYQNSLLKYFII